MIAKISLLILLVAILPCVGMHADAQTLVLEPDLAGNAGNWRPGKGSPRAAGAPDGNGLVLPCPLRQGMDRVYWDRDLKLDLRDHPNITLELECGDPAAVRRLGFYLKSGNGWYVWLVPIPGGGRRKMIFARNDAGIEGQPAGWHKIDGMRISIIPATPINTSVTLYRLTAERPALALVRGTVSTPNAAERNAANSATRRMARWLDDLGISYTAMDDEDTLSGRLTGMRTAMLPYNPHPPPKQLDVLRAFARRGGKLIVFYSADAALADMMGLRLGEYQRAATAGQWNAFVFNRHAPACTPKIVRQNSQNIRPAWPASAGAQIIAHWRDADGRMRDEPAWVRSDAGLWMSHILLNGDDENKKMMLLAILGGYDRAVWREAANHAPAHAGQIGPFHDTDDALAGIHRQAAANRRAPVTQPYLDEAVRYRKILDRHMVKSNWPEAVQQARRMRQALTHAYAAAQAPRPAEFRGVWNHDGLGLYPGDWPRTARLLRDSGITAIFPNLAWAGVSHYPSGVTPASDACRTHGDQLRAASDAARRAGLEMHFWKVCWNLGPTPADYVEKLKRAGRLQRTDQGEQLPWLCPSHPQNLEHEIRAIREAAATDLLDGVHLDYVRYPGAHTCYCAGCRQRFEKWLGSRAAGWPASARNGALTPQFNAWRCAQITALVRQTRQTLHEINPKIKLSTAVYQAYPDCRDSIAQDWGAWLRDGLVDFVVPMNYTENTATFAATFQRQCALPGATGRILPGIGVTAAESQLSADRVIEQILQIRARHGRGFVLFDLNPTLADETLPIIRLLGTN